VSYVRLEENLLQVRGQEMMRRGHEGEAGTLRRAFLARYLCNETLKERKREDKGAKCILMLMVDGGRWGANAFGRLL
jgi:hypothetical protein